VSIADTVTLSYSDKLSVVLNLGISFHVYQKKILLLCLGVKIQILYKLVKEELRTS